SFTTPTMPSEDQNGGQMDPQNTVPHLCSNERIGIQTNHLQGLCPTPCGGKGEAATEPAGAGRCSIEGDDTEDEEGAVPPYSRYFGIGEEKDMDWDADYEIYTSEEEDSDDEFSLPDDYPFAYQGQEAAVCEANDGHKFQSKEGEDTMVCMQCNWE